MKRSELKQLIKDVIEESYESDLHDELDRAIDNLTPPKTYNKSKMPTLADLKANDGIRKVYRFKNEHGNWPIAVNVTHEYVVSVVEDGTVDESESFKTPEEAYAEFERYNERVKAMNDAGTITEEAKKLWKATKPTEDEYAVLDGDFKYLKSFKGADAKVKSKEYADSIADKNTTGRPMGWPTIVKIVTDYGRAR